MSAPLFSDRLIYNVPVATEGAGELLAIREWRICRESVDGPLMLTSLNGEQVWAGPVLESPWSPDEPPGASTGVHGLKHRLRRQFERDDWFYGRQTWAWGWVALSGMVEETYGGYAAERAAIRGLRLGARSLALFATREFARGAAIELEARYQCRVKIGYPEWRLSRTMRPGGV